jgi:hypothetical protein
MPRLRHTVEQFLAKLREAEVALSKGQSVAHVWVYDFMVTRTEDGLPVKLLTIVN